MATRRSQTSVALASSAPMVSIGAVERDTGLSKDILRMWERRYGFPQPLRDSNGERVYPLAQVERLQLIKRLMERGHRPGKIIPLATEDLKALGARPSRAPPVRGEIEIFLDLVRNHQLPELRWKLTQALMKQGLETFIQETIAPLNHAVGDAWMRGDLAVFGEHMYTEQVEVLLRSAVASIQPRNRRPRVLLTTFPNEQHGVGLLMVEALLVPEGVHCVSLGTQTPIDDIRRATIAHKASILALSFSGSFTLRVAVDGLDALRAHLPPHVTIWAGGEMTRRMRKTLPGIVLLPDLGSAIPALKSWRTHHVPQRGAA